MTKENENLMILLDLICQARKQSTYIFIAQQSIIHIKLQNSCVFLQHLCQVYCFTVLLFQPYCIPTPKTQVPVQKEKVFFICFQLLVTTSICCYKRAMIIVDNCNSVDLLNMQTYCQVTSKKKDRIYQQFLSSFVGSQ